jgi:DEAD/DEAH box helicase domain-containing protein
MLPEILANRIQKQITSYITATFDFREEDLQTAFQNLVFAKDSGMFKGPWIDIKFPYVGAGQGVVPFSFDTGIPEPYVHQKLAWDRILKGEHTIVTTGTGSGKTECFLYPVLEHALQKKREGKKGISTIILYPMNALATDQEKRFARTIFKTK